MNEFGFIAKYLSGLAGPEGLDLKDDVAVWTPPKGQDAVISMDTLVEGVHFPDIKDGGKMDAQTAEKLIRVNVSDLVAKGAEPVGYFLSLTLSEHIDAEDLANFCHGLARAQSKYGLKLWGGDTTRGGHKNVLTLTIIGTVAKGKAVLRTGAEPGDLVCITGTIGDSCLGLKTIMNQLDDQKFASDFWANAYHLPEPPFGLRMAIGKYASAALDVSDGLIADAAHMAQASAVGMDIFLTTMPLSTPSTRWVLAQPNHQNARLQLATGGDDYQVLMCVRAKNISALKQRARQYAIPFTVIGKVTHGEGVRCLDSQGREVPVDRPGYSHF